MFELKDIRHEQVCEKAIASLNLVTSGAALTRSAFETDIQIPRRKSVGYESEGGSENCSCDDCDDRAWLLINLIVDRPQMGNS